VGLGTRVSVLNGASWVENGCKVCVDVLIGKMVGLWIRVGLVKGTCVFEPVGVFIGPACAVRTEESMKIKIHGCQLVCMLGAN